MQRTRFFSSNFKFKELQGLAPLRDKLFLIIKEEFNETADYTQTKTKLVALGGRETDDIETPGIHYYICKKVNTPNYRRAINLGITLLSPKFVAIISEAVKSNEFDLCRVVSNYKLPPFFCLNFLFLGFNSTEDSEYKKFKTIIESGGGSVDNKVTTKIDIIVVKNSYRFNFDSIPSKENCKFRVVNYDWILNCDRSSVFEALTKYTYGASNEYDGQADPNKAFSGCHFYIPRECLSKSIALKTNIQAGLGVIHDRESIRHITHFVVPRMGFTPQDKSLIAGLDKSQIKFVQLNWVEDSLRQHRRIDESGYSVDPETGEWFKNKNKPIHKYNSIPFNRTDYIFKKIYFLIVGFPSKNTTKIKDCIEQGGGVVLEEPLGGRFQTICILPFDGSIKMNPRKSNSYASEFWVERCVNDRVFHLTTENVLFQPLESSKPIQGFDKYIFCFTGVETLERKQLVKVLKKLGARTSQCFTSKCTHLVVIKNNQRSKKVSSAQSFGVPIIDVKEIYQIIMTGNNHLILDNTQPRSSSSKGSFSIKAQKPVALSPIDNVSKFHKVSLIMEGYTFCLDKLDDVTGREMKKKIQTMGGELCLSPFQKTTHIIQNPRSSQKSQYVAKNVHRDYPHIKFASYYWINWSYKYRTKLNSRNFPPNFDPEIFRVDEVKFVEESRKKMSISEYTNYIGDVKTAPGGASSNENTNTTRYHDLIIEKIDTILKVSGGTFSSSLTRDMLMPQFPPPHHFLNKLVLNIGVTAHPGLNNPICHQSWKTPIMRMEAVEYTEELTTQQFFDLKNFIFNLRDLKESGHKV